MAKKDVTMKDIAQEMNLSIVSISKALSGKEGVGSSLRSKIIAKAAQMGYVHPSMQGKPSENNTGNVGVIVANRFFSPTEFYATMWHSFMINSTKFELCGIFELVTEASEKNCIMPAFIRDNKVDGVIVMGELADAYLSKLKQFGVPVLFLDFYRDMPDEDSVISDGVGGGYLATRYLLENGHRDIAFVGSVHATSSILDRYLGYIKALIRHGIVPKIANLLEDRDAAGQLIEVSLPNPPPTAFFCNCDHTAKKLIQQLQSKGIRVPQDVSVIGFDDSPYALMTHPHITTVKVDIDMMNELAIMRILDLVSNDDLNHQKTTVPCTLVVRDSVSMRA